MRLIVDQATSFAAVIYMGSAPKTKFQDKKPVGQDATADGTPKWQIQVSLAPQHVAGAVVQDKPELINVNISAHEDPGSGLMPAVPIQFDNLAIGTPRDKTIWYTAQGLRQQSVASAAKKGEA